MAKRTEWSGEVFGSLGWAYDGDFRIQRQTISDSWSVSFAYDDDGLLTRAGSLYMQYAPQQGGLLTGTTLDRITTSRTYNDFGEFVGERAMVGAAPYAEWQYTRDLINRVTQKTETLSGQTTVYDYGYDSAGRLVEVKVDGAVTETYGYDENSNRTHLNGQPIATYDDQDRLLTYGNAAYTYTENGELESKTENSQTTQYRYDVFGNLMQVVIPDGTQIDYLMDAGDRRIGKKVNGTLTRGFLYEDQLNPVAEVNATGLVVSVFIYGDRGNVPSYMIKQNRAYRIISDHLGSPRMVVASDGSIAQRLDYDAWGRVTRDTNPGFQPFGYAGGLYDPDTGLVRFGARDYDPATGRWASKDPIRFEGDGSNLYQYVLSDPINGVDPNGEILCGGICLGAIAGGVTLWNMYDTASDLVDLAQTVMDDCSSWADIGWAAANVGMGAADPFPGNPLAKAAKKGDWKTPREWADSDHDALRDRLRKENEGYESGRHDEYSGDMSKELKRMADEADARGDLPEYGEKMREIANTYKKRVDGARHKGGRRN